MRNLLPGNYHIYVNAYDSADIPELRTQMFIDPLSVDIYLGNGVSSSSVIATVSHTTRGGKWFYVRAPLALKPLTQTPAPDANDPGKL